MPCRACSTSKSAAVRDGFILSASATASRASIRRSPGWARCSGSGAFCASAGDVAGSVKPISKKGASKRKQTLFMTQGLDRVEPGSFVSGKKTEGDADDGGEKEGDHEDLGRDHERDLERTGRGVGAYQADDHTERAAEHRQRDGLDQKL